MTDQLSSDLASLKIDRTRARRPSHALGRSLAVIAVVAVAALVYFAVIPYVESRVFKTEVAVTEIALVSPAQAAIELTSTGYVKPQRVSNVAAKVAGRVAKVEVRQGAVVSAGDVLYELEQADQAAAIAAAQSRVAAARARVQTARANLAEVEQQATREDGLAERGVTPAARAKDLAARANSLRETVKAAEAEVKAAQAEVRALEVNLSSFVVRAPIGGTVISRPPELGELVGLQAGPIEIADFATLAVETDVPEQRLHMVELDGPCEIVLDAFPSKRYRGRTLEIVPRVDRAKATVTVKVAFVDPATGVLPDMSARVSFLSGEVDAEAIKQPPRLVVPASAVVDRGGAKVVFTVEDGRVRLVNVKLGEPTAGGFVLVDGPPAETRVVADPPDGLRDGQKIKERSN
jgi:RND family efflux transporter MFP subunit